MASVGWKFVDDEVIDIAHALVVVICLIAKHCLFDRKHCLFSFACSRCLFLDPWWLIVRKVMVESILERAVLRDAKHALCVISGMNGHL